jgi:hypothetical protein
MDSKLIFFIAACVLFLVIFIGGYLLSHKGKPYKALPLSIHKLLSLGAMAILVILVVKQFRTSPATAIQITVICITAFCFIVTIVTGGLVSAKINMPAFVKIMHKIFPYISVLISMFLFWSFI